MDNPFRQSPVSFSTTPEETETRSGWQTILRYADEGDGPLIIDLSHRAKWTIQSRSLSGIRPMGMVVPDAPGRCLLRGGMLLNRLTPARADAWHLWGDAPYLPDDAAVTDVTDAYAMICVTGEAVFHLLEKVTELDLAAPGRPPLFVVQGPVCRVPCQVVVMRQAAESRVGVLIACARGYGGGLARTLLDAGSDMGLRPGGETAFTSFGRRIIT